MGNPQHCEKLQTELEDALREALPRLYEPNVPFPEHLWPMLGCAPGDGLAALRTALVRAIEQLRPAEGVPESARISRLHRLLVLRYVDGLTQEEVAGRLSITPRHVRREQASARKALAECLLFLSQSGNVLEGANHGAEVSAVRKDELSPWRSQVQQELAVLRKEGTQEHSEVQHTLQTALQTVEPLVEAHGVEVDVEFGASGLLTPLPAAALRQVFVTALMNLLKEAVPDRIEVTVDAGDRRIEVLLAAFTDATVRPVQLDFIQAILNVQGRDAADSWTDEEGVKLSITLPCADRINVLVIDDNADLVHFYQRYTTGTQYNIVPAPADIRVPESIVGVRADVIVLDIMLPDRDGWGLLRSLHADPDTRNVPVIVCSVVREEELALALGARLYVSKPIGRLEFLQALQTALYADA